MDYPAFPECSKKPITGLSGVLQKANKSYKLGLRSEAKIYEDPNTHQRVVYMQNYRENIQGTDVEPVNLTKIQAGEQVNSLAASKLSQQQKTIQEDRLDIFYRKNFFPGS